MIDHNAGVTEADCRHPDGPDAVRALIEDVRQLCHQASGLDLPDLYRELLAQGGQPSTLSELPLVGGSDLRRAALGSLRGGNNPRVVLAEDVERRQHG